LIENVRFWNGILLPFQKRKKLRIIREAVWYNPFRVHNIRLL